MVNPYLQKTATLCALTHALGIVYYQPPPIYALFLTLCVSASVANHSYTSEYLKWLDRACMAVGAPLTYVIAPVPYIKYATLIAACVYGAGKYYNSTFIHSISHYMITGVNILILHYFA